MESIAAVRPNMAVLDQNKLTLSPFGALSHALAEEILARTGQAEGVYPYVPLELLTEPEEGPEEKKEEPAVNVEVKLTLELTREARELRERTETVERILERIERIRERSETVQKPRGRESDSAPSVESRSFFQNIHQHISFPMTLSLPDAAETAQPGGIARISEKFANTLKTMREEGLYTEPGGETRRVADAGRGDVRTAGKEPAGNRAAESGAVPGGTERATADRVAASGRPDRSAADFAVSAAETALNTAETTGRSPEKSPESMARAAERMGQTIAENAAREITETFQDLIRQEARAEGKAVPGRDGGAGTAAQNIDNERGQIAREDIETEGPSRTRQTRARDREDLRATEGADGEGPRGALAGTGDRTESAGQDAAGRGRASPESRRQAVEPKTPEGAERPARAVPLPREDRPVTPEELTLAADTAAEQGGEGPFRTGREAGEAPQSAHGPESHARREIESGAAPRRAGKEEARGSADEDTAAAADRTGTVDRAEGRAVAGETERTGSSQRADGSQRIDGFQRTGSSQRIDGSQRADGSQRVDSSQRADGSQRTDSSQRADGSQKAASFQRTVSAPGAGEEMPVPEAGQSRVGSAPEEPERAALDRERSESVLNREEPGRVPGRKATERAPGPEEPGTETPEASSDRAGSGVAPEGAAREADGGAGTEAEAIPLRGETVTPAPEELTLAMTAERLGDESSTAGRQAAGDAPRPAGRAESTESTESTAERDRRNGTPGTGAATDTVRTETVRENGETGPVREAGQDEETARAGKTGPAGTPSPDERPGQAERPARAIQDRETPFAPAPEELAHRTEEQAAPEAGTRTGGEARQAGEVHKAGEAHNAGEARKTEEVRRGGEARDTEETHRAGEVRHAGKAPHTEEAAHTEEGRYAGEPHHVAEGSRTGGAHDAGEASRTGERYGPGAAEAIPLRGEAAGLTPEELALARAEEAAHRVPVREKRDTHSPNGEKDHIEVRTGRPAKTPVTVREDSEEAAAEAGRRTSERPAETGSKSERPAAEAGRISERPAGRAEEARTAESATPEARTAEGAAAQLATVEDREAGQAERPARAIRERETPFVPAPEELAYRTEEQAAPEAGTRTGGEARQAGEGHKAGEAYRAGEARDAGTAQSAGQVRDTRETHRVGEVRHAGEAPHTEETPYTEEAHHYREAHDAGEAFRTGEIHNAGEAFRTEKTQRADESSHTGERVGPGAAEAIPLRGGFVGLTPEELALAPSDGTVRPDADGKADAAHRVPVREKRDTHSPNGERVSMDSGTGRPGKTPAASREDSGAAIAEVGRTSERSVEAERRVPERPAEAGRGFERPAGRAGGAGEAGTAESGAPQSGTAESAAPRVGTAEGGEAGQAERPAQAIPEHEAPLAPAPEELAHRTEEAAESHAALGPGSTAKSVEAFAERIAERVRRAETAGLGAGVRDRGPASRAPRGTETAFPRRDGMTGAGTLGFPPPVELAGAAEGPREPGSVSAGIPAQPARESAGGVSESLRTGQGAQAAYSPESLAYGTAPVPPAGEASPDGTVRAASREGRRAPRPAERAAGGRAMAGPAPVELTYGGQGEARPSERPGTPPSGNIAESDYVKSLPDWARRFLKEGAGSLGTTAGNMAVTAIPNAQTAQDQQPQMMEWTAPGYRQQPPAETQFKELKPPEDTGGQASEVRISDAEIRRTADRVYKIIEDRIRRERRRLGL